MNLWKWIVACAGIVLSATVQAQEDPGRAHVGRVKVVVVYATNRNLQAAGAAGTKIDKKMVERLSQEEKLRYKHYRLLGEDTQPLLRSYESWAEPLKPSDELLVRFEAQGHPSKNTAVLDLELWLGRKKTVKTDAYLEGERPLFVLGPEWRGGRLIVAVTLAPMSKAAP